MRQQHHIVHFEQGFRHIGFITKHIEACTSDTLFLQRCDQGVFINNRTTCNVNQKSLRPQRIEDARGDEISCCRC